MSTEKPLVANVSDPEQIKNAEKKIQIRREDELNDLRTIFNTPAGLRVLERLMKQCKTFESIWAQSALIHYNSGQQDIGHWIMAEISDADPLILYKLMTNRKKELKNG